jgi:hypothetical protein
MNKDIKKFEEYTQEILMDDVEKIEIEKIDFDPKEWEVDKIIDIQTDDPRESEEKRIEGSIEESNSTVTFDTNVPKDIKRGDHIWITALIKRKDTSYNDPGRQAVIKVRVIDIYYGLSHLNKVLNQ